MSGTADRYDEHRKRRVGPFYAVIYPSLARIAYDCGYSLGAHGTLGRDLDLIAAPWTEEAVSAQELVDSIVAQSKNTVREHPDARNGQWGEKPHGRRGWTLLFNLFDCDGGFIDLAVMPRQQDWPLAPAEATR